MDVRTVVDEDRKWIAAQVEREFGSVRQVSRGHLYDDVSLLEGIIVPNAGFAMLAPQGDAGEVATLVVVRKRAGVGRTLLAAAADYGRAQGWKRIWLVTTNNNVEGFAFYQSVGWDLVALHRDALIRSRELKPEIPEFAENGLPIRHELEFELKL